MKKRLPPWLKAIERLVDKLMPVMLVLLAGVIVAEFTEWGHHNEGILITLDYFIITFFVVDLAFKWYETRDALKFLKLYWIDIIAVFPFYTLFRLYFVAAEIFAAGEQAQKFLHEAVLMREMRVLREAEKSARFLKEARFVRFFARGLRLLRARWYVTFWHFHKTSRS